MLHRLRARLTYANVMSTLAVFIALGGSSYAALTLPRNSVGSNQIRTGAVRSSELHDRSVTLQDLSLATRQSLRGASGPAGPAGPVGAPATRFFASVSAAGDLIRGNATSGGRAGSPGTYVISFAQPVSACSFTATLGSTDASVVPAGRVTVDEQAGRVGIHTYDAAGTPMDLPFHVLIAC